MSMRCDNCESKDGLSEHPGFVGAAYERAILCRNCRERPETVKLERSIAGKWEDMETGIARLEAIVASIRGAIDGYSEDGDAVGLFERIENIDKILGLPREKP